MSTAGFWSRLSRSDNITEQEHIELRSLALPQDDHGSEPRFLSNSKRSRSPLLSAWRAGMALNICGAVFVLIVNISFLAWATGKYAFETYQGCLYRGSCENTERLATLAHLMINILGTLLLSASNYAMQVLAAPTRAEVDIAHRRRDCLCIGVQSFRNFMSFGYSRGTLWILLALSSIPLHLLYNSVVFSATGANAYMIAVVSSDFQNGAPFNLSLTNDVGSSTSDPPFLTGKSAFSPSGDIFPTINSADHVLLSELQRKAQKKQLVNITTEECIKSYLPARQTTYRNVIAVSDNARSNSSVVWIDHSIPTAVNSNSWICVYDLLQRHDRNCSATSALGNMSYWSVGFYSELFDEQWYWGSHPISHCLVESMGACGLKYDMRILVTVIVANLVKVLAMTATLVQYRRPTLVTMGDALASFLEVPDETTCGMCLSNQKDFQRGLWSSRPTVYAKSKHELLRSSGVSPLQWAVTLGLFAFSGLAAAISFGIIYDSHSGVNWSFGGSINLNSIKFGQGLNDTSLIVIANLPQLVLSFNYMSLNRLVTCMAGSREWSLYAYQKKGLRTSQRKGAQRSTFWLQLPFKISIPLMAISAGLHYIASQCLYFGSIQYYAYDGLGGGRTILEDHKGLGYSQTAIHVLMVVLILPIAAAIVWGRQHNKPGIPPAHFCSAAISAACHPLPEEEDVHLKPVQWGEVTQCGDPNEIGHCSFSSKDVMMPVEGREYI